MRSLLKSLGNTKNNFQLGKHWGNATEIIGEEPNHKNITKEKFSASRKWRTTAHMREKYTQQIQNREFHTQWIPSRLREPQRRWMMMRKTLGSPNREGETYHRKNCGGEPKKWRTWMYGQMGMHFGCLLAPKVKIDFPKNGFSPNSNFLPILFPSPCNNYFNQFLAKLNDWVNETRKVVDCFTGSPIDIFFFPIGPKG